VTEDPLLSELSQQQVDAVALVPTRLLRLVVVDQQALLLLLPEAALCLQALLPVVRQALTLEQLHLQALARLPELVVVAPVLELSALVERMQRRPTAVSVVPVTPRQSQEPYTAAVAVATEKSCQDLSLRQAVVLGVAEQVVWAPRA
jgi:hypothetical protein